MYRQVQIFLLFLIPFFLNAQQLFEQKIVAFDGEEPDYYGSNIVLSDSFLFVGAIFHNNYGGAVYVYKKNGNNWVYSEKLVNSDNADFDRFGTLHLNNNYLFIGALSKKINGVNDVGAVYVFKYENYRWVENQKIIPDTLEFSTFGVTISSFGDYLLISADNASPNGSYSGKAYLYEKNENDIYYLSQVLIPDDGHSHAQFGSDNMILDSNIILIGSPRNSNSSGTWAGAVYVYAKEDSLWQLKYKMLPDSGSDFSFYGGVIKASENYLVVTSMVDINGSGGGTANIYSRENSSFKFVQKISAGENISFNNYFGISIAMSDDSIYVGAFGDTIGSSVKGAVYFFENKNGSWIKRDRIIANNPAETGTYGIDVKFKNGQLFVGAPNTRVNNIRKGAVYLYTAEPLVVNEFNENKIFEVEQNYPNPFNSQTSIKYYIPFEGNINIIIYNIVGEEVFSYQRKAIIAGSYTINLNFKYLASGIYFYRVIHTYKNEYETINNTITKKAVFIK